MKAASLQVRARRSQPPPPTSPLFQVLLFAICIAGGCAKKEKRGIESPDYDYGYDGGDAEGLPIPSLEHGVVTLESEADAPVAAAPLAGPSGPGGGAPVTVLVEEVPAAAVGAAGGGAGFAGAAVPIAAPGLQTEPFLIETPVPQGMVCKHCNDLRKWKVV